MASSNRPRTTSRKGENVLIKSVNGEVTWVAKQLRADVAGSAGEVASRSANGTVDVLLGLERTVRHLKETAEVGTILHGIKPYRAILVAIPDSSMATKGRSKPRG